MPILCSIASPSFRSASISKMYGTLKNQLMSPLASTALRTVSAVTGALWSGKNQIGSTAASARARSVIPPWNSGVVEKLERGGEEGAKGIVEVSSRCGMGMGFGKPEEPEEWRTMAIRWDSASVPWSNVGPGGDFQT